MEPTLAQRAAIFSQEPHNLVLAGPGSGKTRTIVWRIEALLRHPCGIDPASIVVITFTNAAARELQERLRALPCCERDTDKDGNCDRHPNGITLGYIGTLHGYALTQLQAFGTPLGYNQRITILDQEGADALLMETAKETGCKSSLKGLTAYKSDYRLEGAKTPEWIALNRYYRTLRVHSMVDFDTILRDFLELLTQELCGEPPTHLIVDEYQDSAPIDAQIYRALNATNTFMVGDGDQAIYSFRGGNVGNLIQAARGADVAIHFLEGNFRSGSAICAAANRLIRHNRNRVEKQTVSMTGTEGRVTFLPPSKVDVGELTAIALELSRREPETMKDIAVLARTNAIVRAATEVLKGHGLPVREKQQSDLPKDWKFARVSLELLTDPTNEIVAKQWIRIKLGASATERFADFRRAGEPIRVEGVQAVTDMMEVTTALARMEVSAESIDRIRDIRAGLPEPSLAMLRLAILSEEENRHEVGEGITVTTIHGAKGREWKTVILVGCEDEIIPGGGEKRDIEEERRLFYVGVTRAADLLVISHSQNRKQSWGDKRLQPATPSRFIAELTA